MPTTTFKDRHGHPGAVGYVSMHLLFVVAGGYGSTLSPSPSVAHLLSPGTEWALRGWAAAFTVAGVVALAARFHGKPRVELAMINVYGGLLVLWALAVAATEPPAIMLAFALAAIACGTWGTTRASAYRLEAGIDRVERVVVRWRRNGGPTRSQGERHDAEHTDDG